VRRIVLAGSADVPNMFGQHLVDRETSALKATNAGARSATEPTGVLRR